MITKLRIKFIILAFLSMLIVLALIIGGMNIVSYADMISESDAQLLSLYDFFEREKENGSNTQSPEDPIFPDKKNDYSPENRFRESRFFSAVLDNDGNILFIDLFAVSYVDQSTAENYVQTVYEKGNEKGTIDGYRYLSKSSDERVVVIFLDISAELAVFGETLLYSVIISASGLLLVLALVILLSGSIVKPVEESYKKQKSFITNAGHDIKTPLAIIDTEVEVIEMEQGESEWTRDIKKQIERLTSLTEKLVFLSRMQEDIRIEKIPFDISESLFEVVGSYEAYAKVKGQNLKIDITEGVVFNGNEEMIRQAVALLMDNAVKYTPDKGKINFSLKKYGKNVEISVKNDVEEIPKGDHKELFERFYRREGSRNSKSGGHGIGLSVVKSIVEAHGGKITAKSEDGKSMEFLMIL